MASKILLALKEKPSFQGELSVHLVEEHGSEGRVKYALLCHKKPPFNTEEFALFVFAGVLGDAKVLGGIVGEDLAEIRKSICWQQEFPSPEAREIIDILEHQVVAIVPQRVEGIDGTTYEFLIERGCNKVQFEWWSEPPRVWRALGEVSKELLSRANAGPMIAALQSSTRRKLIEQLRELRNEVQTRLQKESEELTSTNHGRCRELMQSLTATGLTCPGCGQHSKEMRFMDKSPGAKSYFICEACGRSFGPETLLTVQA
jgi:hypothetical protein